MSEFLDYNPYSLREEEKSKRLIEVLQNLTLFHEENCDKYKNILNGINYKNREMKYLKDLPYLPVRLFKELDLVSVPKEEIFKITTSSGTSGQTPSKIYLDKETVSYQQKVLAKIVSSFFEKNRLPLLIIDSPSVLKNREMFSARGAGILGFSMFGTKRIYALNDDMSINLEAITNFLNEFGKEEFMIFGFTFMVWEFYMSLVNEKINIDLKNGILIHGGGFKKLEKLNISNDIFKKELKEYTNLSKVHNYYGMVEQTGSIYMECKEGHLHCSNFSDIIIRNPFDFSEMNTGDEGIIQVISTVAKSYPGHSLLTEDMGTLLGIDDCKCGRMGKYFKINGRIKSAEIRGCSDTYGETVK
ncbi:MAG: acyl-protein synthetase [Lachnospirales bacterium]